MTIFSYNQRTDDCNITLYIHISPEIHSTELYVAIHAISQDSSNASSDYSRSVDLPNDNSSHVDENYGNIRTVIVLGSLVN